MQKWEFDVFGMVKTNLDWRLVQEDEKPYARIKEWWDTLHLSWTHNTTMAPQAVKQFRGSEIFSIGNTASRVIDKGMDSMKLGRLT
jgi:hypothetical protein